MDNNKSQKGYRPAYQTVKVVFGESIAVLDEIFEDSTAWGVSSLAEWVDDYESTRFTALDDHTAIITSEYNMGNVLHWLRTNTPVKELVEL